jgi:hypothetical protein
MHRGGFRRTGSTSSAGYAHHPARKKAQVHRSGPAEGSRLFPDPPPFKMDGKVARTAQRANINVFDACWWIVRRGLISVLFRPTEFKR